MNKVTIFAIICLSSSLLLCSCNSNHWTSSKGNYSESNDNYNLSVSRDGSKSYDDEIDFEIHHSIVAMNHDDLRPQDYVNTWRIYEKYGFSANFNYVLMPFGSQSEQENMICNVKDMLDAGNTLGLHAILGRSYFWVNKLYDIRPDSTFTYAPVLSEICSDVGDNKNVFGYDINSQKSLQQLGFVSLPEKFSSLRISNITNADYLEILKYYNLYWSPERITGLDLNNIERTWTPIHWLEYWYNELIDDSLGYSSLSFETDYECPIDKPINDYYPDETHLDNGRIIMFDDIENPHYFDSNYQIVGRFRRGLFKDCSTCLNYEVEDRCFEIAKAFCDHYFGTNKLTVYGRHGSGLVNCIWYDSETPYDNRQKTIISGEAGRFFSTRKQKFISQKNILLDAGIKMTTHFTPLEAIYESQVGLYYGQDGIRSPYFNHVTRNYGGIGYLNFVDISPSYSGEYIGKDIIMESVCEDNILKFAYENSGSQIANGLFVTPYLKMILDAIRGCIGTGKIPSFSLDTLIDDASTEIAIETICKYCKANKIKIVPMETARQIAISNHRANLDNYFPNPSFEQSILKNFGDSLNPEVHIPDGWLIKKDMFFGCETSFDVSSSSSGEKAFVITARGNGYAYLETRMFGLPPGNYVLSFSGKTNENNSSYLMVFKQRNRDLINKTEYYARVSFSEEKQTYNVPITIEEPISLELNKSVSSHYSDGYEENISNIRILMGISNRLISIENSISLEISDVRMQKI